MQRRAFLKFSGSGIAAVAFGSAGGFALFAPSTARAATTVDLTMVDAAAEMVDGIQVPMWAYSTTQQVGGAPLGARIPGPILFAVEGEPLGLTISNQLSAGGAHGFDIPGVPGAATGPIPFGGTAVLDLVAPAAGTYMYLDPMNAPVNRNMGLHGALVVLPRVGLHTPYSTPTPNISRLFGDFGTTAHFRGHPWDQDRNAVWLVNSIDPAKCAAAFASGAGISPVTYQTGFLPQYFTINGKSGFYGAQHGAAAGGHMVPTPSSQSQISLHGNVGQPCLIRCLNAGLMWQSLHIHGNHVYQTFDRVRQADGSLPRVIRTDLHLVDTWTMQPETIRDVVLPFIRPPDVPTFAWPPVQERFPLLFPMHDHQELSNTAAGANYPQGCVTHFQIDGDVSAADEVLLVDRAELRLRTGEYRLEGRISRNPNRVSSQVAIHAGPDATGPEIGVATIVPGTGGLDAWSLRGRALKAIASRQVSVHATGPGSHAARQAIPLTLR